MQLFPLIPLTAFFSAFNHGSFRSGSPVTNLAGFSKKKSPYFRYFSETKATRVFASRISVFFLAPPAVNINKGISTHCGNFLFASWHDVQFLSQSEIICQGIEPFCAFEYTETLSLLSFFWISPHRVFFVPREQLTVLFARMEHLHKTTATCFFL